MKIQTALKSALIFATAVFLAASSAQAAPKKKTAIRIVRPGCFAAHQGRPVLRQPFGRSFFR